MFAANFQGSIISNANFNKMTAKAANFSEANLSKIIINKQIIINNN